MPIKTRDICILVRFWSRIEGRQKFNKIESINKLINGTDFELLKYNLVFMYRGSPVKIKEEVVGNHVQKHFKK